MLSSLSTNGSSLNRYVTPIITVSDTAIRRWTLDNTFASSINSGNLTDPKGTVTFSSTQKAIGTHSAVFLGTRSSESTHSVLTIPTFSLTTNGFSASLWFYRTSMGVHQSSVLFQLSTSITLVLDKSSHNLSWNGSSNVPFDANTWNHVVLTMASDKTCNVWLNGVKVITNHVASAAYITSVTAASIGGPPVDTFGAFRATHGNVDDVRIYNSILTESFIQNLYNNRVV